ncbi:MAG: exopolysaccharide biosynthesis protein [Bryobacterales bacterium]|nr:exopolysaccharide biosynthesis protein [Bryobacterales bacterium]
MIDVHSHILHGLDDGAATFDVSLAMVRLAAEWGTTDIVASPHSNLEYKFDPAVVESRLAELREAAGDTAPRLHYGCDFHLSFDNIQDAVAHPTKYTINHGRYLLVEFSDLVIFPNTTEIFARLLDAGMIPVITHPERNTLLQQKLDKLREWAAMGCLLQVTAQSFNGRFGRRAERFSRLLLDEDLVHVVASDAHDTQHRPPNLGEAYEWLAREKSEALAERLCVANPGAVIRSEPLPDPATILATGAATATGGRKWYQFWK